MAIVPGWRESEASCRRRSDRANPSESLPCCSHGRRKAAGKQASRQAGKQASRQAATALAALCLLTFSNTPADAQSWSQPFNHNQVHAGNGAFTSPYSPWNAPNSAAPLPRDIFSPTVAPFIVPENVTYTVGAQVNYSFAVFGGVHYGWPQSSAPGGRSFNAIHMAVIPKGPYRGHVLVWDDTNILATQNPPIAGIPVLAANEVQPFQAYAIIDPADAPLGGIRYRNFLVPIGEPFVPGAASVGMNLFCAGHAWSPHGDLIIAGGSNWRHPLYGTVVGGWLTYVFNPRLACIWPGSTSQVEYYPSPTSSQQPPTTNDYSGLWVEGPDLVIP